MWDDLEKFKLPDPKTLRDKAISTAILSETLVNITNHYLDWSQHEPEAKHSVNLIKSEIADLEKMVMLTMQESLALNFDKIPSELKKNASLQMGWIRNNKPIFNQTDRVIKEKKNKLIAEQKKLDFITSRMSAAKHVLDVGRSLLSAMKEELRNL